MDNVKGAAHEEDVPPTAIPVTETEVQVIKTAPKPTNGQLVTEALAAETAMFQVSLSTPTGDAHDVEVDTLAEASGLAEVIETAPDDNEKTEIRFRKKGATPGTPLGRLAPLRDASAAKLNHRSTAIKRLMAILR